MKTNYEKLMKINYEKLLIFYLPFTSSNLRFAKRNDEASDYTTNKMLVSHYKC